MSAVPPWDATDEALAPLHTCGGPHGDGATVWQTWKDCHACQVADYDDEEIERTGRRH